jgi:PAS domain S-box-containing protein
VKNRTFEIEDLNKKLKKEIATRIEAENSLIRVTNTLNCILNSITESAIISVEFDHHIIHINPTAERFLGYPACEIIGKKVNRLYILNENVRSHFNSVVDKAFQYGRYEKEIVSKGPDGDQQLFLSVVMPMIDHEGVYTGYIILITDITHKKQIQDRLIMLESQAAMGRLAASIANDINSPLQGIASLLSSIKRNHSKVGSIAYRINLVEEGFRRIRSTVKKLLNLNRSGKVKKENVNVNRIIEETVSLMQSYLKERRIKIDLELSSNMPDIKASYQQLSQCLLNMINYTIESMTSEMGFQDRWKRRTAEKCIITITSDIIDDNVVMKLSDTGPGIKEKNMEFIFYPFFPEKTKPEMGVGLSICHSIIKDHHGTITDRNNTDGGVVFTIKLPVNRKKDSF